MYQIFALREVDWEGSCGFFLVCLTSWGTLWPCREHPGHCCQQGDLKARKTELNPNVKGPFLRSFSITFDHLNRKCRILELFMWGSVPGLRLVTDFGRLGSTHSVKIQQNHGTVARKQRFTKIGCEGSGVDLGSIYGAMWHLFWYCFALFGYMSCFFRVLKTMQEI